jgi:magnesium chelatase family protein
MFNVTSALQPLVAGPHLAPQSRGADDVFTAREVREFCATDAAAESLLRAAVDRLGLSARAYHRVLRLARTVADLEGAQRIEVAHVAEAVQYRGVDRRVGVAFSS